MGPPAFAFFRKAEQQYPNTITLTCQLPALIRLLTPALMNSMVQCYSKPWICGDKLKHEERLRALRTVTAPNHAQPKRKCRYALQGLLSLNHTRGVNAEPSLNRPKSIVACNSLCAKGQNALFELLYDASHHYRRTQGQACEPVRARHRRYVPHT